MTLTAPGLTRVAGAFAIAMTAFGAALVPVQAETPDPGIPIPRLGYFVESPSGYIGCVRTPDRPNFTTYCVSARVITEGAETDYAAIDIRALHMSVIDLGELLSGQLPVPPRAEDFHLTASPDALTTYIDEFGRTAMTLNAEIPGLGGVELEIQTEESFGNGAVNDTCVGYPLHYELESLESVVTGVWRARGSVDDVPVGSWSICDAYFVGPTSGMWRIASGL